MDVNPLLVIAFVVLVAIMIYRYLEDTFTLLERLDIPGPKPIWIFGNVKPFYNKWPIDVFVDWKKIYGKIYGFYEGFRAGIVINDPEMARQILCRRFENFHMRTPCRPFQYHQGKSNLLNLDGENWKHQRHLINRVFNIGDNVQAFIDKVSKRVKVLVKNLEQERRKTSGSFDISSIIYRFTTETRLTVLVDLGEDELAADTDIVFEYQKACSMSSAADNPLAGLARLFPTLRPLLQLFDGEHKLKLQTAVELIRKYLRKTTEEQESEEYYNLLNKLLSSTVPMRNNDGSLSRRKLKEDEILAHVLAFLAETFETVSSTIMFVLYELALHPNEQDILYREIFDQDYTEEEDWEYSQLQSFTYLEMVINESFRLHPIAPGVSRTCTSDCVVNGIQFKKGMTVRTMTSTLYQDHEYFQHPDIFDPERFTAEAKRNRHPFTFLPFGQGPRKCPGYKIALIEVKLAVVEILRRFSLHRSENTEVPLKHALRPSLCPANGVTITLRRR